MSEMKEKMWEIQKFFGAESVKDLSAKLLETVLGDNCKKIFDEYLELVGNVETDFLQKGYQFYLSDRGKGTKQQDFTPTSIAKLCGRLAECPAEGVVYDCCAGSGALTIAKHKQDNSLRFVCEELDEDVIPFLLFNLAIRGIEADVIHGDVLKNEIYKVYTVKPYGKYSKVEPLPEADLQSYELGQFDAVISNPPYNISWNPPQDEGLFGNVDERFAGFDMPPKGNANFAFVLHCIHHTKTGGSVSMILPGGILSEDKGTKNIRKQLIDNKLIDSVVVMPDKMFESTSISTCLLTLRQGREGIALVDARQTCHEEIRHQRGEGDKSHTSRIYHKALKAFTDEDIEKIVCAIEKRENVPEFSKTVTPGELAEGDYILTPTRYIEFQEREETHRPFADIVNDIRAISKEINAVKITMNQTIARQMGWDKTAELVEQSAKNTEKINNTTIKLLGLEPIEPENWIRLSKNAGEIKIENTSKESISSLFAIFMPMLKQHIYYLNNRENELLKELQQALLPELMSGKLDVSGLDLPQE